MQKKNALNCYCDVIKDYESLIKFGNKLISNINNVFCDFINHQLWMSSNEKNMTKIYFKNQTLKNIYTMCKDWIWEDLS